MNNIYNEVYFTIIKVVPGRAIAGCVPSTDQARFIEAFNIPYDVVIRSVENEIKDVQHQR